MSRHLDRLMIAALIGLWALFFWRLLTPVAADQASFTQGDFSGQFFAFAGYQYARFTHGEVPLWNPHNNGGLPFIGDTQAAVFYPPRLLTIALAYATGGWRYAALQLEVIGHGLAFTLMMYTLARKLTGSPFGGAAAALIAGYGGFMAGYPPLQLAILEAASWFPAAALGIATATDPARDRPALGPLLWTGFSLGLSWMAGHPQTSFFLTYLLVAWFAWRCIERRADWRFWLVGTGLFGLITVGLAAVQLFPGAEYLAYTTRVEFGYDAKANGFPIGDVVQAVLPGVISQWSPLYVGVSGLALAAIGVWRRGKQAGFWLGTGIVALLWSFGGNSALFPLLYNIVPGLRFFRGQERAALLVVLALALAAAWGAAALAAWDREREHTSGIRLRLALNRALTALLALGALVFVSLIGNPAAFGPTLNRAALAIGAVLALSLLVAPVLEGSRRNLALWGICAVLAFELFTVNIGSDAVYDPIPAHEQVSVQPPPLLAAALDHPPGARVDGARGLTDNYASLYGLNDIRGISPLWLANAYALIEGPLDDARAWEVFAVSHVFSDWQQLPVASRIIASGVDRYGPVNLHQLADPRPFALVQHEAWIARDAAEALEVLGRAEFNPRRTIILEQAVSLNAGEPSAAETTAFTPERIVIAAETDSTAILSIALPFYPGWSASLDGAPVERLRAYGALTALEFPPGSHTIELVYNPLSYRIGAAVSLGTAIGLASIGLWLGARSLRRRTRHDQHP